MIPSSPEAKLRTAIRQRPELAEDSLANFLCEHERDLVWEWAAQKLCGLIRATRRQKAPDPDQMAFPFHDLSVHIPLPNGYAELRTATIGILRRSERFLSQKRLDSAKKCRPDSMLGRIRRQIEIMEPYAYRSRRITVERVLELRAEGVTPVVGGSNMGDAMRRYWGSKTPEERAAIMRRRMKRWANRKKAKKAK